jgi:hypothetical protein
VCKSTALGTYLLDPSDLTSLQCWAVDNPHYKSQPPMTLYRSSDVLLLCEQKYPDGVENERKERERKQMERLKHIEDGKDVKRMKTEDREEWIHDLFREYGVPPMGETERISPNQVNELGCLIKKVRNDKTPSITSIFKKEASRIAMECFERQEKVNRVEQLLSELSPEVARDPYNPQKKKETADGVFSPEECLRILIDQGGRRKNLLGLFEEHSKEPENISKHMEHPMATEHIFWGPGGCQPLAVPVIDALLCKERRCVCGGPFAKKCVGHKCGLCCKDPNCLRHLGKSSKRHDQANAPHSEPNTTIPPPHSEPNTTIPPPHSEPNTTIPPERKCKTCDKAAKLRIRGTEANIFCSAYVRGANGKRRRCGAPLVSAVDMNLCNLKCKSHWWIINRVSPSNEEVDVFCESRACNKCGQRDDPPVRCTVTPIV